MKSAIRIVFAVIIILLGTGFYMQSKELENAEKVIGFGVLLLIIVLLPLFLYYRYRDKNAQDYLLTPDKWEKIKQNFKKNM